MLLFLLCICETLQSPLQVSVPLWFSRAGLGLQQKAATSSSSSSPAAERFKANSAPPKQAIFTHIFLKKENIIFFLSPGLRSLQGLCRPDPPDQDQPGRPGVVQEPGLHHTGLHAVPLGQRREKVSYEANNFPNRQIEMLSYLPNTKKIFGPLRRHRDCERRPLPPQGERCSAPAGRHPMAHDQHLPAPKGKSFP